MVAMELMEYGYDELEDATEGFALKNLVGKGSHGCVYKARLPRGQVVAVKRVSKGLRCLDDLTKLENELGILTNLPASRPTYFVDLLGVSRQNSVPGDRQRLIVMKFMPNGTLHDVLFNNLAVSSSAFTWFRRAVVALQISEAVDCLHQMKPPVVHRDIKSTNILFDEQWRARLGDFGLAFQRNDHGDDDRNFLPPPPAGTIGYMDPLYTCPSKLSTKNDVFSFGVVLLEMIVRQRAVDVEREPAFLVHWVRKSIQRDRSIELLIGNDTENGRFPADVELFARPLMEIALNCVSMEKRSRPSMKEIARQVKRVVDNASLFPLFSCFVGFRLPWVGKKGNGLQARVRGAKVTSIVCKIHQEEEEEEGGRRINKSGE